MPNEGITFKDVLGRRIAHHAYHGGEVFEVVGVPSGVHLVYLPDGTVVRMGRIEQACLCLITAVPSCYTIGVHGHGGCSSYPAEAVEWKGSIAGEEMQGAERYDPCSLARSLHQPGPVWKGDRSDPHHQHGKARGNTIYTFKVGQGMRRGHFGGRYAEQVA
jgi:hypothetical protein